MRNVTTDSGPTLFPLEVVLPAPEAVADARGEDQKSEKLVKEFVRWCFSFGNDFRNSPDVTNLRFWLQKNKIKPSSVDEESFLPEARRLFMKRVESAVAKASTSPNPSPAEQ